MTYFKAHRKTATVAELLRAVLLMLAGLLASPQSSHAFFFKFAYIGNSFTSASAPYTVNDRVTAEFVLNLPTISNLPLGSYISALQGDLVMSDGKRSLQWPSEDLQFFPEFALSTDATGAPTSWQLAVDSVPGLDSIFTYSFGCVFRELRPACDFTHNRLPGDSLPIASISNAPGSWVVTTIPEPGAPTLLMIGLAGLFAMSRIKALSVSRDC